MRFTARSHGDFGPRLEVAGLLNDVPVGTIVLAPQDQHYRFLLPEEAQLEGRNLFRFRVREWRLRVPDPSPHRRPWIALRELEIGPRGVPSRGRPPSSHEGGIRLPSSSSASFYLKEVAPFDVELEAQGTAGQASRVEVAVAGEAGRESVLDVVLRPGVRKRASATARPAKDAFLRLEVKNSGTSDIILQALRVRAFRNPPKREAASPARSAFLGVSRPNIAIFLVDTLRADHLGLYGHERATSPNLDALGRESITFDDCSASSSWTAPSVTSLFTGLGPEAHGVEDVDSSLVPEIETLAERLRSRGYRTAAFVANHVLRARLGYAQGFDEWNGGDEKSLFGKRPRPVVDRAVEWLRSAPEPFFLYVHVLDPHDPYEPPERHWRPFRPEAYAGLRDTRVLGQGGSLGPEALAFLRSAYEGEIHEADDAFGVLVEALRSRKLVDRTLLAFTADHGEEFQDHGRLGHARTLYREVLRVPLVIRLPRGDRGGERVESPVQHVDLFSTLLAVSGAEAAGEGRPLWEAWTAGPADPHSLLHGRLRFGASDKRSVRDGLMTMVVNDEPSARFRFELFDLGSDPEEREDLARKRPIVARYLRERMATFVKAQADVNARLQAGTKVELAPEETERLRALGYLGN
jgi:arylsulfatase A-like enzyme